MKWCLLKIKFEIVHKYNRIKFKIKDAIWLYNSKRCIRKIDRSIKEQHKILERMQQIKIG